MALHEIFMVSIPGKAAATLVQGVAGHHSPGLSQHRGINFKISAGAIGQRSIQSKTALR